MTRHCMVDLETLGNSAGCAILSIGATMFGEGPDTSGMDFYEHLLLEPQIAAGLHMDPSTVLWWLAQGGEARAAILAGQAKAVQPQAALEHFAGWLTNCKAETVWGNGADFDQPILIAAYKAFGRPVPWKYNAGRCCRTIFDSIGKKMGAFGTHNLLAHDALSDAKYQASEVEKALKFITKGISHDTGTA